MPGRSSVVNANLSPFGFTFTEDSRTSLTSSVTGPGMGLGLEYLLIHLISL